MIQQFILGIVISLVMKAIEKAEGAIDWAAIIDGTNKAIVGHFPHWLVPEIEAIVDPIIADAQKVLEQGDNLKHILKLLAAKDFGGAIAALKDLLMGIGQDIAERRTLYAAI